MADPLKLITNTEAFAETVAKEVERSVGIIKEFNDERRVRGMVVILLLADGSNWTHVLPIEDNLKMIGAMEAIKFEALAVYHKVVRDR